MKGNYKATAYKDILYNSLRKNHICVYIQYLLSHGVVKTKITACDVKKETGKQTKCLSCQGSLPEFFALCTSLCE